MEARQLISILTLNRAFEKKKPAHQAEAASSAAKETVNKPTYLIGTQLPIRGNLKSVSKVMPVKDAA